MMQKKHESDLTRKEKWQLEREKVASMSWKKRIEYFFTYYKWVLVVAVAVIALGVFGVNWYKNLQKEELLNVVIVNSSVPKYRKFKSRLRKAENQRQESDYHDRYFRLYQRRKSDDI